MDFKFVLGQDAVAVISCKSYLTSIRRVDAEYCRRVHRHVNNVWLFAECCPKTALDHLRQKAKEAGYQKLWYLYTWDDGDRLNNPEVWLDCMDTLEAIIKPA